MENRSRKPHKAKVCTCRRAIAGDHLGAGCVGREAEARRSPPLGDRCWHRCPWRRSPGPRPRRSLPFRRRRLRSVSASQPAAKPKVIGSPWMAWSARSFQCFCGRLRGPAGPRRGHPALCAAGQRSASAAGPAVSSTSLLVMPTWMAPGIPHVFVHIGDDRVMAPPPRSPGCGPQLAFALMCPRPLAAPCRDGSWLLWRRFPPPASSGTWPAPPDSSHFGQGVALDQRPARSHNPTTLWTGGDIKKPPPGGGGFKPGAPGDQPMTVPSSNWIAMKSGASFLPL